MIENDLLEMAEDCKQRIEEKNEELEKLKIENHELKKEIMTAYGFVRILDNLLEECIIEREVKNISDILRTHLSNLFDKILSYSIEDDV